MAAAGWQFPARVGRVYVNRLARDELGWAPRFDLDAISALVASTGGVSTPLARVVGSKEYQGSSYHRGEFRPASSDA